MPKNDDSDFRGEPEAATQTLSTLTPSQKILLNQLEEIKRLIKEEFKNFRAALKLLKQ